MKSLSGPSNFSRSLWLSMGTLALFFITFGLYSYSELQVKHSHMTELKSVILSNELRQTSDDLSRMVRLYVSTGNPLYKQYYQEILDIRDGKAPRPVLSDEIYWDLVLANDLRPRPNERAVSLLELMRQAHFTASELLKLSHSKSNSDRLTHIEFAAMKLIESPSMDTDANRLKALEMLSDTTYLLAKRDIMQPIADFNLMVKQRTEQNVHANERRSSQLLVLLILCSVLLVYMLWRSYRALNATLGCSADKLRTAIMQIGGGNLTVSLSAPKGAENSVVNWLIEMRNHLLYNESEQKKLVKKIQELAYYDMLTNLPNRRMLSDRLTQALALSKRTGQYGALMFIDLDHFKPLNDQHGHDAGDLLLLEMTQRLRGGLREIDTVARLGGDEFVVMLSELADEKSKATANARLVAEKIRKILAKPYKLVLRGAVAKVITHRCPASIGVVIFQNHENTEEELLKFADMAMYQAKESGRNQVRVFEKEE